MRGMQRLERTLIALSATVCLLILLGWAFSFGLWTYGLASWNMSLLWQLQWSGDNTTVILSAGDLTIFGRGRIQKDIGTGFSYIGHEPSFTTIPHVSGESRTASGELDWSWRIEIPPPFLILTLGIPTALFRLTQFEQKQLMRMRESNILRAYIIMLCIVLVWTAIIVPASTWRSFNSGEYQLAVLLVATLLGCYGGTVARYGVSLIGMSCLWFMPIAALHILDPDKLILRIFGRYDFAWYQLDMMEKCAFVAVVFATAAHVITRLFWIRRATKLANSYSCQVCRYNLTGNISGICPECGTKIDLAVYSQIATR